MRDEHRRGRLLARPGGGRPSGLDAGTRPLGAGGLLHVPPAAAEGLRCPVVVLLHGAGSSARAALSLLADLADDAALVLLAPQSARSTWDVIAGGFGPDVAALDAALEELFAACAVDTARIALGGFSDGASYALSLGVGNGDLVTHVVAFSPGFLAPEEQHGRPRVLVTHGVADPVLPIDRTSRRIVPLLRRGGYDVTYDEFDGGHVVEPVHAVRAVAWLGA